MGQAAMKDQCPKVNPQTGRRCVQTDGDAHTRHCSVGYGMWDFWESDEVKPEYRRSLQISLEMAKMRAKEAQADIERIEEQLKELEERERNEASKRNP